MTAPKLYIMRVKYGNDDSTFGAGAKSLSFCARCRGFPARKKYLWTADKGSGSMSGVCPCEISGQTHKLGYKLPKIIMNNFPKHFTGVDILRLPQIKLENEKNDDALHAYGRTHIE